MRWLFLLLLSFYTYSGLAQSEELAKQYYNSGDYKKALLVYQSLVKQKPGSFKYIRGLVKTHQELQQYNEAETLLLNVLKRLNYPPMYIDVGKNYLFKKDSVNANMYFQKAVDAVYKSPNYADMIGKQFEKYSLLDQAIEVYTFAMKAKPTQNFNFKLARIYGEQGNIDKMFNSYLNSIEINPKYIDLIKRYISDFITEDSANENNVRLRKLLLKKIQLEPNLIWNNMLSWLFVQQRQYKKAFAQEKAIFNRNPESFNRIEELAQIVVDENERDIATSIFNYLIDTAQEQEIVLKAHQKLLQLDVKYAEPSDYNTIASKYEQLLETYGRSATTNALQLDYAHFLAFYNNAPETATKLLNEALENNLNLFQIAKTKLKLADILVLQERFNEALIYYTQIQKKLKNTNVSQEARFKVAKTSYYKGDFKWAESQLKILKQSVSQLTANDALDLKLLISDNKYGDSLQTALRLYAKADFLHFQNKPDKAISVLNTILNDHKTETIVTQALLKQALLFEEKHDYAKAEANYKNILANYPDHILTDNALYNLARLYEQQFENPELAKPLYEQLIFNHEDSIYYIDARKRYRRLRGDAIN